MLCRTDLSNNHSSALFIIAQLASDRSRDLVSHGRIFLAHIWLALVLLQSMAVVNYSSPRVKNVLLLVELEGMFVVGQSP